MRPLPAKTLLPGIILLLGCGSGDPSGGWDGTMTTLESGRVVVENGAAGVWQEGEGWRVVEELRLGSLESEGPEMFGQVRSVELDEEGRVWVLEGQAQEIRVFDATGEYVRTVGRKGGGPGELSNAVRLDRAADGNMWVMDPENGRLSVFDTAGTYLEGHTALGGFVILPWPGGFDAESRYYAPVPNFAEGFRMELARFGPGFTPIDTMAPPRDPVTRDAFTIERDGVTRVSASIPFSGGLTWRVSPQGTFWALLREEYRLDEIDSAGDTLRTVQKSFEPIPVTGEDIEQAMENLEWFIDQGGRVDRSLFPSRKPPTRNFFLDDLGHLWVSRTAAAGEDEGRVWDIFDPEGRFLGELALPFNLALGPLPRVHNDVLYGVVRDEMDVPYVVRARVVRSPGR